MNYAPPVPVEVIAQRLGVSEWVVRRVISDLHLDPVYNTNLAPHYDAEAQERVRMALADTHDETWEPCGSGWQRKHHNGDAE